MSLSDATPRVERDKTDGIKGSILLFRWGCLHGIFFSMKTFARHGMFLKKSCGEKPLPWLYEEKRLPEIGDGGSLIYRQGLLFKALRYPCSRYREIARIHEIRLRCRENMEKRRASEHALCIRKHGNKHRS